MHAVVGINPLDSYGSIAPETGTHTLSWSAQSSGAVPGYSKDLKKMCICAMMIAALDRMIDVHSIKSFF